MQTNAGLKTDTGKWNSSPHNRLSNCPHIHLHTPRQIAAQDCRSDLPNKRNKSKINNNNFIWENNLFFCQQTWMLNKDNRLGVQLIFKQFVACWSSFYFINKQSIWNTASFYCRSDLKCAFCQKDFRVWDGFQCPLNKLIFLTNLLCVGLLVFSFLPTLLLPIFVFAFQNTSQSFPLFKFTFLHAFPFLSINV